MRIDSDDRELLRRLANRWMELAALPEMADRRRQWTALKDLHAERPMVLFETWTLENYVAEDEIICRDPILRGVERSMRMAIRQAEEIGDDYVVEPYYRIYWDIQGMDYGVPLEPEHAEDGLGGNTGYTYQHPIHTPQDLERLRPRTWQVEREKTLQRKDLLEECFGDILPIDLHGTGSLHSGLTGDLFKLLGNDNLLAWTYDQPEALQRAMAYLRDDRLAYYGWLESQGLLGYNHTGWELVGSGSPGYTHALPQTGGDGPVRLRDLWVWMESQETTMISPRMFGEFFLPYMAEVCARFGLVYYGCCEPVHDRWERVIQAIPNIRAVSVSPWCDRRLIAEKLGRRVVFSRKPWAAPISGSRPDWDALRQDLDETLAAGRDCNLEIIYRDVYRIHGDRPRLRQWADMVRSRIGN